jgi:hypothetical protein
MKTVSYAAAAALAGVLALGANAAQARTEAGTLTCDVSGGIGLILGSHKSTRCTYKSVNGRVHEVYKGAINKFGLDVGVTGHSVIVWQVFAPSNHPPAGALAGTYSGVSANASAGVGGGANALVGGNSRTITLQPLSLQAQTGVNLAVGIGSLTLRPVRSVIHSHSHRH